MKLRLKPHSKNRFPIGGLLIKSTSPRHWILEIQRIGLPFSGLEIYPIPGLTANSVWGCFVVSGSKNEALIKAQAEQNELVQQVTSNLFIAEKSILYPNLTLAEIQKLFPKNLYVLHPEFGFAELSEPIDYQSFMSVSEAEECVITSPETSFFTPKKIKSFQVITESPEEVLKDLENKVFPKEEGMNDEPLNLLEKGKLQAYQALFSDKPGGGLGGGLSGMLGGLGGAIGSAFPGMGKLGEQMMRDFEELKRRNQEQLDKLMEMLKNDPNEALKYAIPLDSEGTSRGGVGGEMGWLQRWGDFSLFGDNGRSGGSGGGIDLGDRYFELLAQYRATAQQLEAEGEHQKAAFIYMKLLKDFHSAATALENGKHYKEAAVVYLKKVKNKVKAAECYEKGNMILEAIELYKELQNFEKVGDLYVGLNKRKEANSYYQMVANKYITSNQYLKASLIYREKMHDKMKGQDLLLRGWVEYKDAYNCLNNYFVNIEDSKDFKKELDAVFENHVNQKNRELFLRVLTFEYDRRKELSEPIREMAYEAISAQIPSDERIVSFLKNFNRKDKELVKDTIRFKVNRK